MSDGTQRGWWQASDGRWYPPSAHPDARAENESEQHSPYFVAHHSYPYESVHVGDPRPAPQSPSAFGSSPPAPADSWPAPHAARHPNSLTSVPPLEPQNWAPSHGFGNFPTFTAQETYVGEPHPFAGMGQPSSPMLHPVPPYHSEPLPQFTSTLAAPPVSHPPARSRPAWHEPSPRQSPWVWIGLVVAILVLIPIVWVGAAVLNRQPATPASSDTPQRLPVGHLTAGANPMTATAPLKAGDGKVVYSDDFHDQNSGWTNQVGLFGTKVTYGSNALTITPKDWGTTDLVPPFHGQIDQIAIALTASVDGVTSGGDGVTALCRQQTATGQVEYRFGVSSGSTWSFTRSIQTGSHTDINGSGGVSQTNIGATPVSAVAVCATLADGRSTRVALFVDGTSVMDRVETADSDLKTGWSPVVQIDSSKSTPSVSLHKFEVRNLGQ